MKKVGYKKVRLIISGFLLFQALIMCVLSACSNWYSKVLVSYVEVPAYVTDVWEYNGGRYSSTRYKYTIVYTYEGQEYKRRIDCSSSPDEDLTRVWINPVTMNISEDSRESYEQAVWGFGAMAIVAFLASIISFVVITVSGKRKLEIEDSMRSYVI